MSIFKKRNKIKPYRLFTKKKPEKGLLLALKKRAGRSRNGRITVRHQGGGVKKLYRIIDFGEEKLNLPAKVIAIEYDPYRTSFIALLEYQDKSKRYQILAHNLKVGDDVICTDKAEIKTGNRMKLKNIPVGTAVYNIELEPNRGGKLVRSAGSYAQLMSRDGKFAIIKMPSGETRMILQACKATIGMVSNQDHQLESSGKAGRSRWLGRRPRTRGVAMNPVDHPMGGGEGRASGGHPRSRKGTPAKGYKTRSKKKNTNKYIVEKRKK